MKKATEVTLDNPQTVVTDTGFTDTTRAKSIAKRMNGEERGLNDELGVVGGGGGG